MRNRPRLRLADEIRYIQRRAAARDGRVVTVDQLVLFSTETGDAWLLDPSDYLAARLARDGDPESIALEETDTSFQIAWPGSYRLDGLGYTFGRMFSARTGSSYRLPAVKEKHSARGRESPRADRPIGHMARDHNAGE